MKSFPSTEGAVHQFKVGEEVVWSHQPHGGYGYLIDVPAVVVSLTAKRIRIAAQRVNQSPKLVLVWPCNLRHRRAA